MIRHLGSIRYDYKPVSEPFRAPSLIFLPRRSAWFAGGLVAPIGIVLMILGLPDSATAPEQPIPAAIEREAPTTALLVPDVSPLPRALIVEPLDRVVPPSASPEQPVAAAPDESEQIVEIEVGRGDTLERLFRRVGLNIADMFAIVNVAPAGDHLTLLRPGDRITVRHDEGRVLSLSREIDEVRVLQVERQEDGFEARVSEREVSVEVATAHAVVNSSLFNAGRAAGLSDRLTMTMAALFQWDIDFALEIRQGDEFTIVYEERWRDGERLADGNILAAEFVNRGRSHRVVRFEMEDGADYFTPEGESIRQAFIRAPVDFTRISSEFNLNRRHPVLNTIRAHRGVDYAAPTGTPIRAAGDGRVSFRGVSGGYGNTVILEHGGNITTLYAHISRFHPDVRVGTRVRQGQVIAYVGATGLATGPHLHYEYRVNGVHRNPRTVELPRADPVPSRYRDRFRTASQPLLAQLTEAREEVMLAMSSEAPAED